MDFNDVLGKALKKTVGDLRRQSGPIREREFEDALLAAYAAKNLPGSISRQARLRLNGFGGVGNCDVAVALEDREAPILLELKWGVGTLYNCAWDAVKLALALREGAACAAYLVAGAPRTDWDSGQRGSDLFGACEWQTSDFMAFYTKEFAFWRSEVKVRPELLPARLSLIPTHRINFDLRDKPWSIRASRVSPVGRNLLAVDEHGLTRPVRDP